MFLAASVMPEVCRWPQLEFKDPVIKSVWTSCRIKLSSLRDSLAFSKSLNVRKINDDDSTCYNVITFSMVIIQAHKQMDFINSWKIKQFNTWCLWDLLKQKKIAIRDQYNITVFILHSLLFSLLLLSQPAVKDVVLFKCVLYIAVES